MRRHHHIIIEEERPNYHFLLQALTSIGKAALVTAVISAFVMPPAVPASILLFGGACLFMSLFFNNNTSRTYASEPVFHPGVRTYRGGFFDPQPVQHVHTHRGVDMPHARPRFWHNPQHTHDHFSRGRQPTHPQPFSHTHGHQSHGPVPHTHGHGVVHNTTINHPPAPSRHHGHR